MLGIPERATERAKPVRLVAQNGSLPYRRMAFCGSRLPIGDTAGCHPAIRFRSATFVTAVCFCEVGRGLTIAGHCCSITRGARFLRILLCELCRSRRWTKSVSARLRAVSATQEYLRFFCRRNTDAPSRVSILQGCFPVFLSRIPALLKSFTPWPATAFHRWQAPCLGKSSPVSV